MNVITAEGAGPHIFFIKKTLEFLDFNEMDERLPFFYIPWKEHRAMSGS